MRITLKDVAKLANVSVGTASMAVNNKEAVNEETKLKVLDAVKKLNYRPNHYARSLITNKSLTIGLIITDITNPFFGMIVACIQKEVEKAGYNLLLGISNDKVSKEKKLIEYFVSRDVEGLIIVPTLEEEYFLSYLYNLKSMGIPFVFITTSYKGIKSDCVMTDLAKGSYELTKFLIRNGNRKIYFMTGYKELLLSSLRMEGYKRAYHESNLDFKESWIIESYPDYISGYNTTTEIIKDTMPDAIITVNDIMAMGVLKCLMDNKIKVPKKVSVAGYDDLLFSSILETPLTTVRQPIAEMCKNSIEILMDRIGGQTYSEKLILLEPELMIRASTRRKVD